MLTRRSGTHLPLQVRGNVPDLNLATPAGKKKKRDTEVRSDVMLY